MIDTVLLDAGGVILDETEFERVRAEVAVVILAPVVPGYDGRSYWTDIREAVACYSPSVYRYVIWKRCGCDLVAFDALWTEYMALWRKRDPGCMLMPGIGPALRDLATDYALVIAGQYGSRLMNLLEAHDLAGCLSTKITQDDFSITKPDPRYYEQILQRAGRFAERSIMVGDRIDKDVIPAKAVGMRTIRVRVGIHASQEPRTPDERPDIEVASVADLPEAVRRLSKEDQMHAAFEAGNSQ